MPTEPIHQAPGTVTPVLASVEGSATRSSHPGLTGHGGSWASAVAFLVNIQTRPRPQALLLLLLLLLPAAGASCRCESNDGHSPVLIRGCAQPGHSNMHVHALTLVLKHTVSSQPDPDQLGQRSRHKRRLFLHPAPPPRPPPAPRFARGASALRQVPRPASIEPRHNPLFPRLRKPTIHLQPVTMHLLHASTAGRCMLTRPPSSRVLAGRRWLTSSPRECRATSGPQRSTAQRSAERSVRPPPAPA